MDLGDPSNYLSHLRLGVDIHYLCREPQRENIHVPPLEVRKIIDSKVPFGREECQFPGGKIQQKFNEIPSKS